MTAERTFFLEIVTPERTFYAGECASLIVPTLDGSYGVMAGHEPIVTAVETGVIRYKTPDGMWHFGAVSKGFAEVMQEAVILLVGTAEHPSEIDEARAREAMERATTRMGRYTTREKEYHFAHNALERAKARLEAKRCHDSEK